MSNYSLSVECIKRLTDSQKDRLRQYRDNLAKDKDPQYFDDVVRDFISPYLTDLGHDKFKKVNEHNDSVKFTASRYDASQIDEHLEQFAKPDHKFCGWLRAAVQAKEFLFSEFEKLSTHVVEPQNEDEIVELLPKKDTHAGWLYIERGMKTKGEYIGELLDLRKEAIERGLDEGNFGYPLLIGTRTQASAPWSTDGNPTLEWKSKTRLVAMVDCRVILTELPYAKRTQDALGGLDWYAGGKDDPSIHHILRQNSKRFKHMLTLDYSKFDMHQSSWLIRIAFEVVRKMLIMDERQEAIFNVIQNSFLDKTFVSSEGLVHSFNGVPSGDMFTQIIDSVVNRFMVLTYLFHKGFKEDDFEMMIMGDDNIIFTNTCLDKDDIAGYITYNFGIEVNPVKVWQGERPQYPEFLSKRWTDDGCERQDEVVISKLLYPERYANYNTRSGNHPKFKVVAWLWSCPVTMRRLINVRAFMEDNFSQRTISLVYSRQFLTGYLRYHADYWSNQEYLRL